MVGVLFVCLGNICRSPTAEAVFRAEAKRAGLAGALDIDSAGTSDYHIGEPPDRRAQAAARTCGILMDSHRGRQVKADDFRRFDYVLAMDEDNRQELLARCPGDRAHVVRLFLEFAPEAGVREVPDPFYGGPDGFLDVLDLCTAASKGLLAEIRRLHPELAGPHGRHGPG